MGCIYHLVLPVLSTFWFYSLYPLAVLPVVSTCTFSTFDVTGCIYLSVLRVSTFCVTGCIYPELMLVPFYLEDLRLSLVTGIQDYPGPWSSYLDHLSVAKLSDSAKFGNAGQWRNVCIVVYPLLKSCQWRNIE